MSLLIPTARMGIAKTFGVMFDAEGRNGLEILSIDDNVVIHFWKSGEKFYTVETLPERAQQIAECLDQAARHIKRAGGSGPSIGRVPAQFGT